MKSLFTLLLFCFFAINPAQNPDVDSLLMVLKRTKNVDGIATIQNQISEAYQTSDADLMQKCARLALGNSKKNSNRIQQAKAHQNIGISFIILGNYQEAVKSFNSSEANHIF